jgi:hypothetical protein
MKILLLPRIFNCRGVTEQVSPQISDFYFLPIVGGFKVCGKKSENVAAPSSVLKLTIPDYI